MTYKETSIIELKKVFIDKIKHEIIAFLNSEGGVVYVGISDDGTVVGIDKEKQDEYDSILSSWIRDTFYPNTSNLIKFFFNQDDVMEIHVSRGTEKPYYLVSKGPVPSGVFIRIGRSSRSATQDEILKMLVESRGFSFESSASPNQELNFVQFGLFASEAKLDVNAAKYLTLGLKNNAKEYSNLGLLVSDENPVYVKFAVYKDKTRVTFLNKKEFRGSIVKIAKDILDFLDVMNEKHIEIVNYQPERIETRSYPEVAIRESVMNAICHTDYTRPSQVKVEFFQDRLEISSPGNIYGGITLKEVLSGKQSIRHPKLINLLDKLDMIENYGTGLQRTLESYEKYNFKPEFIATENFFTIVLPNVNYHLGNTNQEQPRNNQETTKKNQEIDINLRVLELISKNPYITRKELEQKTGATEGSIRHHMEKLKKEKKIKRVGSTKSGHWIIV